MSHESDISVEFLSAKEFVHRSLGRLGVKNVVELSPRQHVGIALAFQYLQCEVDTMIRIPQLEPGADREKATRARNLLCGRGGAMLSLIEELNGIHSLADVDEVFEACLAGDI